MGFILWARDFGKLPVNGIRSYLGALGRIDVAVAINTVWGLGFGL